MVKILVIAEVNGNRLDNSVCSALAAARMLSSEIDVLIASKDSGAALEGKNLSAARVLHAKNARYENPLAEDMAQLVAAMADQYTHILAVSSSFSRDYLPRAAALLDIQPISDVIAIEGGNIFKRYMYAGNVLVTVKSDQSRQMLTIRRSAFAVAPMNGEAQVTEITDLPPFTEISEFIKMESTASARPDLNAAKIIVSGGRGLANQENFAKLEKLADKLGAAIGASRAAVDMGLAPNDWQVGQTGKIVAPDLYMAFGISGAIQHLAGMKDSKILVAVNTDANAPIFQMATYGLVQDAGTALDEMITLLGGLKS